ncbi:hypothetical protein ACAG25_23420 [Mycobacterium sp. pV006]|uniref:hypothetical protein n=1 Tax=Mycobacterium sp. pV006 TaxID=3238983 RepID=UPI00351AF429
MLPQLSREGSHTRGTERTSAAAARTALVFTAAGIGFLALAAIWLGTCTGSTIDPLACGAPQRALLGVGAPAILAIGGIYAGARSSRAEADQMPWLVAAGWLLVLTVLTAIPHLP